MSKVLAKFHRHQHWQLGASAVEFCVFGPLLMVLVYMIYDINQRLDESIASSIAVRHSIAINSDNSTIAMKKARQAIEKALPLLTPNEASQLQENTASYDTPGSSLTASIAETSEDKLLRQPNVRGADDSGYNSSYNGFADGVSTAAIIAKSTLSVLHGASTFGVVIEDKVRSNVLYRHSEAKHNLFSATTNRLLEAVNAKDDDISDLDFRAARRLSLRAEDGFHTKSYRSSALFGMGLGLLGDRPWYAESEFDKDSKKLQTRCMGRFASDNSCQTTNGLLPGIVGPIGTAVMGSLFDFPDGDSFPQKLRSFLEKWIALQGLTETIASDFNYVVEGAKEGAGSAMEEFGKDTLDSALDGSLKGLTEKNTFSSDVLNNLNLGTDWQESLDVSRMNGELKEVF